MVDETIVTEENENIENAEVKTEDVFYGDDDKGSETDSEKKDADDQENTDGEEIESDKVADSEKEGQKEETKEDQGSDNEKIDYDLKLDEETLLSDDDIDAVRELAEANKLSNEAANEVLKMQNQAVLKYHESLIEQEETQIEKWADEIKNDTILGGDNLERTVNNSKAVLAKYGSDEFIEILRDTGYGNNPEVVRFLAKLGAEMEDDTMIKPGAHGEKPSTRTADLFYGKN